MHTIQNLKNCKSLSDLASLLGFSAKSLSYILYIDKKEKYTEFQVNKKLGGKRTISKPYPQLKLLQKRLADILYACIEEMKPEGEKISEFKGSKKNPPQRKRARKSISHGYEKGLSITTNAEQHTKKRFVYNIDIESFFSSFNFGRVRGFFIKNKNFKLNEKVATIIAQIACHKNQLPQGSPCSPVISNLLCKGLDYRLLKIAKEHSCTYTRYVDDLTFSTNQKNFPKQIAYKNKWVLNKGKWILGKKVEQVILESGFKINNNKNRMQMLTSKQEVTGLTVNKKVNVSSQYYRDVRAMCNSLFNNGYYKIPEKKQKPKSKNWALRLLEFFFKNSKKNEIENKEIEKKESLEILNGKLAHIYNVKSYRNKFSRAGHRPSKHDGTRTNNKNPFPPINRLDKYEHENHTIAIDGIKNLYGKFLFFKYFYFNKKPIIVCEGKTDNIYIKCALKSLEKNYPSISNKKNEPTKLLFFNRTKNNAEMLKLAEGIPGLTYLVETYKRLSKSFKLKHNRNPVIIVVDNDKAGRGLIKKAEEIRDRARESNKTTTKYMDDYFFENLYIVQIEKKDEEEKREIEDLFEEEILKEKLNGKTFERDDKKMNEKKNYGKAYFAENIVIKKQKEINFDNFKPLLSAIEKIVTSHDPGKLN